MRRALCGGQECSGREGSFEGGGLCLYHRGKWRYRDGPDPGGRRHRAQQCFYRALSGVEKPNAPSTVPNVVGKTPAEANKALTNAGLIMKVTGATSTGGSTGSVTAISQSAEAGTELAAGSVVTVRFGAKTTD